MLAKRLYIQLIGSSGSTANLFFKYLGGQTLAVCILAADRYHFSITHYSSM